jgi:hypothetical protein
MIRPKISAVITRFHFYLLGLVLLNFLLKNTIDLSINYRLAYISTLSVYLSGIILFISSFRPFKRAAIYYSIYMITPILPLLLWLFGGIFFGLLASIALYPIYPDKIKMENEKIAIYNKSQGFIGACCPYIVNEKKFLLLEKKITEVDLNQIINFDNVLIESKNGQTELTIQYNEYDSGAGKTKVADTIISIKPNK